MIPFSLSGSRWPAKQRDSQQATNLDRSGKLRPKTSSIRSLVRDNAAAGLLHRVQNGLAIPGQN